MPAKTKSRKDEIADFVKEQGPVRRDDVAEEFDLKPNYAGRLLSEMAKEDPPRLGKHEQGLYDLPTRTERALFDETNRNADVQQTVVSYPLGRAGAGDGRTSQDSTLQVDARLIRSKIGRVPSPDEAFWTQVEGDSMSPWIESGEYVFAIRQDTVSSPGRYIVWWGGDEAEICVHLARLGKKTLRVTKYGPEEFWDLKHQHDDVYELPNGDTVRLRVRGRVEWPTPTAQSVLETVTDQMGKVLKQAIGGE